MAPPRRLALSILLLLGATGCDELLNAVAEGSGDVAFDADAGAVEDAVDTPDVDLGPDPYEGLQAVVTRFDLEDASFYGAPWPSDLRRDLDGSLDLSTFPVQGGDLVGDYVAAVDAEVFGFSLMPVFYAGFDGSLEGASVPSPAASLDPGAVVQLLALDAACGERVPIEVRYRALGDNYHDDDLVIAVPVPGFALRPGARYAYVITRGFGGDIGRSAAPTDEFAAALRAEGDAALGEHLAPLRACLRLAGLSERDVATAGVFTTQSPERELRAIRDAAWGDAVATPVVESWQEDPARSGLNGRQVWTGTYETPMFQEGTSPFTSEGGAIRFDAEGRPQVQGVEQVPFTIVWSSGVEPPYRLLVWSGGTGASQFGFVTSEVTAAALRRGFVVANFVPQFHDTRATPGSNAEINSFNLLNPDAFRNVFRQQVADTAYFARLLLDHADQLPGLPALDTSRVAYAGHSQGALVGAMVAGVETVFDAYVFNGLGAYLSITALERTDPVDFAFIVRGIADIEGELDRTHPVLMLAQTGADAADSHAFARFWRGWEAHPQGHDVFVSNGLDDATTPVRALNAITVAGGLTPIAPAGWDPDPFGVWSVDEASLPIAGNVRALDGTALTMATYLSGTTGHFTIQQRENVRELAMGFLSTAMAGEAVLAE